MKAAIIAISLGLIGAVLPHLVRDDPAPAGAYTAPDWDRTQSLKHDLASVFPKAALVNRVSGHVVLSCTCTTSGWLKRCRVKSEDPEGWAVGEAALNLSTIFKIKPATLNGEPIEAPVDLPFSFQPP